jgi:tripartite-type tricarboxylate transporter receptor subunit TctC
MQLAVYKRLALPAWPDERPGPAAGGTNTSSDDEECHAITCKTGQGFDFTQRAIMSRQATRYVTLCMALLASPAVPAAAEAQGWQPSRPVRWIVPYVPGGANDLVARTVADPLSRSMGQQFVVDNRPGASGTIAYEMLARATPDGHTLGTAPDAMTVLPFVFKGLSFDPRTSFTPITTMTTQPMTLTVNAALPVKTVAELIEYARGKQGGLSYGTSGTGTSQHLTGELLKHATGIEMTHIPYKGAGRAVVDLVGGQVPLVVVGASTAMPQHRAGRARIIAVTTAKRSPALPDVPTLDEAGVPGFDIYHWIGVIGPPNLPREIVARLNAEIVRALASPVVHERFSPSGLQIQPSTPEQMSALIRDSMQRWGKVIAEAKLKLK